MAKVSDLCEDLLEQIMLWLPPESLLRFKCVQKSWYTLINTLTSHQNFVNKHLHNSRKKSSYLIFKFLNYMKESFSLSLCDSLSAHHIYAHQGSLTIGNAKEKNQEYLSYVIDNFSGLDNRIGKIGLMGSHCNGIICLANNVQGHILLCNPATRDFKILRCSNVNFLRWIGFGHDPIDNVYKIVKVYGRKSNIEADVYTLGTETWRKIKLHIEDNFNFISVKKQVYCKGIYYWLISKDFFEWKEIIYSFDFHHEEFRRIPLPDKFQREPHSSTYFNSKLTTRNEHVAFIYYPRKRPIDVWILHESSKDHTSSPRWTRLKVAIYPPAGGIGIPKIPLGFWKTDELLIREGTKGLISYNIFTTAVTIIERGDMRRFRAFGYVKSLVSVGGTTPTRITNSPDHRCTYSLLGL